MLDEGGWRWWPERLPRPGARASSLWQSWSRVHATEYGRGYYGAVLEAWYAVVVVFVMVMVLVLVLGGVLDHAYFSRHVPSQPDAQGS